MLVIDTASLFQALFQSNMKQYKFFRINNSLLIRFNVACRRLQWTWRWRSKHGNVQHGRVAGAHHLLKDNVRLKPQSHKQKIAHENQRVFECESSNVDLTLYVQRIHHRIKVALLLRPIQIKPNNEPSNRTTRRLDSKCLELYKVSQTYKRKKNYLLIAHLLQKKVFYAHSNRIKWRQMPHTLSLIFSLSLCPR